MCFCFNWNKKSFNFLQFNRHLHQNVQHKKTSGSLIILHITANHIQYSKYNTANILFSI